MAYIGKSIESGTFSVLDTSGNTYNGSNTTFSLGTQVGSTAQLLVSHDGVIQKPGTDYTLASGGTQITFTTAPASGASIFIVEISGAVGGPLDADLNGTELILDTDGDTSITADTDDQIDFKIAGADDLRMTANNINVLSGTTLTIDSGATITNSGTANGFGALAGIDDQSSSNDDQLTITDTAVVINEDSDDVDFRVESNGNANMLFVDGGNNRVILGSATSVAPMSLEGALQVTGNSVNAVSLNRFTADDGGFDLIFLSSRNATPGSNTVVQDNDELGALHFCADDGTDYASKGAKIYAKVNGTPGGNDIPTELIFATTADGSDSPTDRLYIDKDGDLSLGTSSVAGSFKSEVRFSGNPGYGMILSNSSNVNSTEYMSFRCGSTQEIGSIQRNGGADAIAFNTSSDYRLKQDIADIDDGITRLKTLQPRRFKWKSDTSKTVDGFIAHEVTAVPESITGTKDETENKLNVVIDNSNNIIQENVRESAWTKGKADGTFPSDSTWSASKTVPKYQQIDQAKLVPLLTAALQEAVTKIEALEARVTTLEG